MFLEINTFSHIHKEYALPNAQETLSYLKDLAKTLPLLQSIQSDEQFKELLKTLIPFAKHFQTFEDVLILGTGGSSLGGQTLLSLRNPSSKAPRIHFLDNIDPHTFQSLFSKIDASTAGVIAISKSGNTAETLMQLLICLQHWLSFIPRNQVNTHFVVISEPLENGIRCLSKSYAIPCIDHPTDIGGRFAAFTAVGILPSLIANIDIKAVQEGARDVLSSALEAQKSDECLPLQGALAHMTWATKEGYTQTILMPYIDRLNTFTLWFRQLWAESLGKNNSKNIKPITPIQALGTVDQHSQLQLYLDGPKDKLFTVITMDHNEDALKVTLPPIAHKAVDIFHTKTMGELMEAEQKATIDTLRRHNCPTRIIHLPSFDEKTLGGLMMYYILETLAMADLMGINPFDQPAVEESKILTQQYLSQTA